MTDRVTSSLKSIEEEFVKMNKENVELSEENKVLRVYINKIETNLEKMVEHLSFYENMFKDCPKPKKNYNLFENKSTQKKITENKSTQKKTIPMVRSGEYHMTKVANDWRS